MAVPKYDEMFDALLKAMHNLGGSASNSEIEEETAKVLNLSEEQMNEMHRGNRTKFSYRLAWTRTYLKNYGIIENSSRGVWALTPKGFKTQNVEKEDVNAFVKNLNYDSDSINDDVQEEEEWKTNLLNKIMLLSPKSFEILCQRILRESGFDKVEVTGRPGDGGIDGEGIFRLGGLLSIKVIFQCKKYQGSVGSVEIRNFLGTLNGRSAKGLFLTTGTFTSEARKEASREGVELDLIDGISLVEKMKDLGLGVIVEEDVNIDDKFFEGFD